MDYNIKPQDYSKIGQNIRYLRIAFGETQETLGYLCGYSRNAISQYESGDRTISSDTLEKIARHYNRTVDELINDDFSYLKSNSMIINPQIALEMIEYFFPIIQPVSIGQTQPFNIGQNQPIIIG